MIACLSIPYFAAAVERRGDTSLVDKPLAIGGQPWESKPIYAYSRETAKMGVRPGMSLRLAHVLSPQSHFMPAGESEYGRANAEIVDVLLDFPGLVEPQELWHLLSDSRQSFTISGRILPARYYLDLEGWPLQESLRFSKEIGQRVRLESHLAPSI